MALLPTIISIFKTFWIPIALYTFRNGLSLYHQLRATYASNAARIRPCPPRTQRALNLLFFSALTVLIFSFQSPPNVFRETQSKLQTSPDVLFSRLRHTRPLTPADEVLREKLKSKESKLLYLAYGHDTLANCTYCSVAEPSSYLIFLLPAFVATHLAHAAVLAVSTSALFTGSEGARWRPHTTLASLALAAGELYLLGTYNIAENVKSTRWTELDFFHDNARLYRFAAFIAIDVALAGVMWLSATQRLFVRPLSTSERLQGLLESAETGVRRQFGAGSVLNAVARDRKLRERWEEYWRVEGQVSGDAGVVEAERRALERVNMNQLVGAADLRAADVVDRMLPEVMGQRSGG